MPRLTSSQGEPSDAVAVSISASSPPSASAIRRRTISGRLFCSLKCAATTWRRPSCSTARAISAAAVFDRCP